MSHSGPVKYNARLPTVETKRSLCLKRLSPHYPSSDQCRSNIQLSWFYSRFSDLARNASPISVREISVEKEMFTKNKISVKDKSNGVTTPKAIGVTPEKFDVPNCLNLSFEENPKIKPAGARDVKKFPSKSYKQCVYLEGSFSIKKDDIWNVIYYDGKLDVRYYS
ncbi:hypothetical protein JTB14_029723 [Gonioctena quinquepunctata]|nr:hypothetical protein JTB14_029723 [Gonioctena quinquepunctata]